MKIKPILNFLNEKIALNVSGVSLLTTRATTSIVAVVVVIRMRSTGLLSRSSTCVETAGIPN